MKKILFGILLVPNCLLAQKLEQYCELTAQAKAFSNKVSIAIDYGEHKPAFKDTRLRDDDGNVVKFNTLVDGLNYMGAQGWKLFNAFPISNGSVNVYHFFFKREYDAADVVPATTK